MQNSEKTDGRNQRQLSNRQKLVHAMLELALEDSNAPDADAIALRSGVSRRSLFRIFGGLDALLAETAEELEQQLPALFPAPAPDDSASFEANIQRFLDHRIAVHEYSMKLRQLIDKRSCEYTALAQQQAVLRDRELDYINSYFLPYLQDRADAADLLQLILFNSCWSSWAWLRVAVGLSAAAARGLLLRQIMAVFY